MHQANDHSAHPKSPNEQQRATRQTLCAQIQDCYGSDVAEAVSRLISQEIFREGKRELTSLDHVSFERTQRALTILDQIEVDFSRAARLEVIRDLFQAARNSITLHGEDKIEFLAPCCPDYEFDPTTLDYLPKGVLRDGPGLCALSIFEAALPMVQHFADCGFSVQLTLRYADFEALDEDRCSRCGVSSSEFLERVTKSRREMQLYASDRIGLSSPNLTVSAGLLSERMSNNFALETIPEGAAKGIFQHLRTYYERLFGHAADRADDRESFLINRARLDISDRFRLARYSAKMRSEGQSVCILTRDIPAFVRFYNFEGGPIHLPVGRVLR